MDTATSTIREITLSNAYTKGPIYQRKRAILVQTSQFVQSVKSNSAANLVKIQLLSAARSKMLNRMNQNREHS